MIFLWLSAAAARAGETRIWFETELEAGLLSLQVYGQTQEAGDYRYRLKARRLGTAGSAVTSQGGRVTLARDQKTPLARLNLSLPSGEQARISLELYDAQNVLLKRIEQNLPDNP